MDKDVLTFIMEVKDRLQAAREIVEENAIATQAKQKAYYDKKARKLNLQEGDKVLLLLLSSTHNFQAHWQGPYTVVRRLGKVNYEKSMPDKGGRKQVYHVNHLRRWTERGCQVNTVIEDGDGIEPYQWSNHEQEIKFGKGLTQEQKLDILELLSRYQQLTSNTPGRTGCISHRVRTTDSAPVRQKPYRTPQAYRDQVMEELDEMERSGIIEKSNSEWAAPLVIVKKKFGSLRLCVDYCQLNQISRFNAYPMPRCWTK